MRWLHIALQLHKGLLHGIGAGRSALLALHHRQRNAVHKQHNVRNDELLHAARRIDAELVDGVELIVFRVGEIDQLDHRVLLAGHFVDIHLGLEQQLLNGLVGLQQGAVGLAQNLVVQVIQLLVSQPWPARRRWC